MVLYVSVSRYKNSQRVRILQKVTVHGVQQTRLIAHVGSARNEAELTLLKEQAKQRIADLLPQQSLLDLLPVSKADLPRQVLRKPFAYGLWQILGTIYDQLGLPTDELLKYLVLARIATPKSKRATVRYLADNLQFSVGLQTVYDYMDTMDKDNLTATLLAYAQKRALARSGGATAISVVFYDVTTLYFETNEDDEDIQELNDDSTIQVTIPGLRKKGYSKDHRFDLPQVVVGLTVDNHGFPLDFQIYEGNTYEGQTLLAGVQKIQAQLNLDVSRLTVVADAGMLSQANLELLESSGYHYIVGARIRSLTAADAEQILTWDYTKNGNLDTTIMGRRMVVTYSDKRAKRSKQNRERLIVKLQAKLRSGQVVKKSKYVVLEVTPQVAAHKTKTAASTSSGKAATVIGAVPKKPKQPGLTGHLDMDKLARDARFDGLKGYVTNTAFVASEVVAHYSNLWNVEQSFRMSKSDLRARPTFHYKRERVISHLTLCVCALGVLRAFEEKLQANLPKVGMSVALEQLLQMREYQVSTPGNATATFSLSTELSEIQQQLLRLKV